MKYKKIAIITWIYSINPGTLLQAIALRNAICKIDEDAKCIHIGLKFKIQEHFYRPIRSFKDFFVNAYSFVHKKALKEREDKYRSVREQYLEISKEIFHLEELGNQIYDFDYWISGSDQIWNYEALDFTEDFLLRFEKRKCCKIAYAVSMGQKELSDERKPVNMPLLMKDYDYISTRDIICI